MIRTIIIIINYSYTFSQITIIYCNNKMSIISYSVSKNSLYNIINTSSKKTINDSHNKKVIVI